MKTIKLLNQTFEFRKSSYAYKDFEDRNKRAYNPALASDILEFLYSCIVAGHFYKRIEMSIDVVDFYDLIDQMEEKDPELLYKDNKKLFSDLLNISIPEEEKTVSENDIVESDSKVKKKAVK